MTRFESPLFGYNRQLQQLDTEGPSNKMGPRGKYEFIPKTEFPVASIGLDFGSFNQKQGKGSSLGASLINKDEKLERSDQEETRRRNKSSQVTKKKIATTKPHQSSHLVVGSHRLARHQEEGSQQAGTY